MHGCVRVCEAPLFVPVNAISMHTHDYETNPDNTLASDLISRSTTVHQQHKTAHIKNGFALLNASLLQMKNVVLFFSD